MIVGAPPGAEMRVEMTTGALAGPTATVRAATETEYCTYFSRPPMINNGCPRGIL